MVQPDSASVRGSLILLQHAGGDTAASADLDAVGFRPRPDLATTLTACRSPQRPTSCHAVGLAGVLDERRELRAPPPPEPAPARTSWPLSATWSSASCDWRATPASPPPCGTPHATRPELSGCSQAGSNGQQWDKAKALTPALTCSAPPHSPHQPTIKEGNHALSARARIQPPLNQAGPSSVVAARAGQARQLTAPAAAAAGAVGLLPASGKECS